MNLNKINGYNVYGMIPRTVTVEIKLRLYRLYKERVSPEQYIFKNMPIYYRQSLARLRSSTLPIRIETGRLDKIPLNDKVCHDVYFFRNTK
jgi:hypothetical protein